MAGPPRLVPAVTAAAGLAAGAGVLVVMLRSPFGGSAVLVEAVLSLAVGWSFIAAGLVARRRRPGNALGTLLVVTGFSWFVTALDWSPNPLAHTVGLALGSVFAAVLAHLLLAFPAGRLEGVVPRVVVAVAYVDALGVQLLSTVFDGAACACPANLLLVVADDALVDRLFDVQLGVALVLAAVVLGLLLRRWHASGPHARRASAPVLWSGVVAIALFALTLLADRFHPDPDPTWDRWLEWAFLIAFAAVPLSFGLGLLRARLAHAGVARLVRELGEAPPPGRLRDALARSLGDPGLTVAYWLPEQARYVDVAGSPVALPGPGAPRVAAVVEREGVRVAALVHDAALRDDPELVEAVGAAAGLALENERLHAELRTRLDELASSRTRLVEAADAERRRIERNLHDGTQQRLVSVSMALGLAETRMAADPDGARDLLAEARDGLSAALEELRRLSHGIHPAVLSEGGLELALRELALTAPLPVTLECSLPSARLPEAVEAAAYYVVAEALANVAKHAAATSAEVRVTCSNARAVLTVRDGGSGGADPAHGSGLRGLADRVAALGGSLVVASPPGGGTLLTAELPCA